MFNRRSTINTSPKSRELKRAVTGLAAITGLLWGAPALAVPGLTFALSPNPVTNSNPSQEATATCPAGKKVYQVGADITIVSGGPGSGKVLLQHVFPSPDLTQVIAKAVEHADGFAGTWSLRARAICGNPVPGLIRKKGTGISSVSNSKQTDRSCDGLYGYGTGFALQGAADIEGRVFVTSSEFTTAQDPAAAAGVKMVVGTTATANVDNPGFNKPWSLDTLAICGSKAPGYVVMPAESTPLNQTSPKTLSLHCSGTKKHHGTAFKLLGSLNNIVLEDWFSSSAALSTNITEAATATPVSNLSILSQMVCAD